MMITPSNQARLSRHQRGGARRKEGGGARHDEAVKREPPGLLASRWFWGGGLLSLAVWALVIWAIWKLF